MRDEFRQVERLRGVKCFPGGETQFVGADDAGCCCCRCIQVRVGICHLTATLSAEGSQGSC